LAANTEARLTRVKVHFCLLGNLLACVYDRATGTTQRTYQNAMHKSIITSGFHSIPHSKAGAKSDVKTGTNTSFTTDTVAALVSFLEFVAHFADGYA